LDEEYVKFVDSIKSKRGTLQALTSTLDVGEVEVNQRKHAFALKYLDRTEARLLEIKEKREDDAFDLKLHKTRLQLLADIPITDDEIENVIKEDESVKELRERIAKEEEELALAAKYLKGGKESKLYKDLLREIEGMKKDLNQLREQLRDDTIEKIRANRTGAIEAAILQLEESLRVRKEQEDQLQKKVENLRARTRL